jgi:DDE superfamily endonuclease
MKPEIDPQIQAAKAAYKQRLSEAVQWLQGEGSEGKPVTAARIYQVDANAIRMALKRARRYAKQRAQVQHGGQNKVLSDTQSKAIEAYCYEQWEMGMGATKKMVYAAICFLVVNEQRRKAPSWRWFQKWLKNTPTLHTIKTKPIARNRVETHTEKDIENWFERYRYTLDKYKVQSARNIYNMDESGARVGCPTGEEVVVPIHIKELYTASPENRKSVTIIEAISADGREPPPLLIICPGKRIMESWIHDNLKGGEVIALSPTGYTNEGIAIAWLKHFIKYTNAGPDKPWKILLLDGHITHENEDFIILAHENHIKPFEYPSHLTHILQPLDVGVFRPWKHYHNQAIHHALRNLDFEYTITSFFRDLSNIQEQTFKEYTIKNVFSNSGMWPISFKVARKKMREYSSKKRKVSEVELDINVDDPFLFFLYIFQEHIKSVIMYSTSGKSVCHRNSQVPQENDINQL